MTTESGTTGSGTIPYITQSSGAGNIAFDLAKYIGGTKSTETGSQTGTTSQTGDTAALEAILANINNPKNLEALVQSLFSNAARQVPGLTAQFANATGTRVNHNTMLGSSLGLLNENLAQAISQAIVNQQKLSVDAAGKIADVNKVQTTAQNSSGTKATGPGSLGKAVGTGLAVTGAGFALNKLGDKALKKLGWLDDPASPAAIPSTASVGLGAPGVTGGTGGDIFTGGTEVGLSSPSLDFGNEAPLVSDPGVVVSPVMDPTEIPGVALDPGTSIIEDTTSAPVSDGSEFVGDIPVAGGEDVSTNLLDDLFDGFADGGRISGNRSRVARPATGGRPVRGYADGGGVQISDPTFARRDKFGTGSNVRGGPSGGERYSSAVGDYVPQQPHIIINVGSPAQQGDETGRGVGPTAGGDTTDGSDPALHADDGGSEEYSVDPELQGADDANKGELEAGDDPETDETGGFEHTVDPTMGLGILDDAGPAPEPTFQGRPSLSAMALGALRGGAPGLLFELARSMLVKDAIAEATNPQPDSDTPDLDTDSEKLSNDPFNAWWGNSTFQQNSSQNDVAGENATTENAGTESSEGSTGGGGGAAHNYGAAINEFADGGSAGGIIKGKKVGKNVDNILIAAQADEYVLPADVVKYVGEDVLDDLVASIHTPVKTGTHG